MHYGPNVRREKLPFSLQVGETRTFTIATTYDEQSGSLAGTARNVTTGSGFLVLDPDRDTIGTVSATSTTASVVDSRRTEADNLWKYVRVTLRDQTDGQEYTSRVTGSTQSTMTFAVDGFPVAAGYNATASDTYVLQGYPLLTWTAANMSSNNSTVSVGPTNATMYAGTRELHYLADFGTDAYWYEFEFEVM